MKIELQVERRYKRRLTASLGIIGAEMRAPLQGNDSSVSRGLKGTLKLVPIKLRGLSLSDSQCDFSSMTV